MNKVRKVLISFAGLLLTGCFSSNTNKEPTIFESGFFKYILKEENNTNKNDKKSSSIVIIGFTALGNEQTSIDIPREIDGYSVKYIGLYDEGYSHYNSQKVECSENLKKLFVFDNIESLAYVNGKNVEMMFCSNDFSTERIRCSFKKIFIPNKLFLEQKNPDHIGGIYGANVMFDYNLDSNQGNLYRIDNASLNETICLPPNPLREGYSFEGWYLEPECINKVDLESYKIENEEEHIFYAGWSA